MESGLKVVIDAPRAPFQSLSWDDSVADSHMTYVSGSGSFESTYLRNEELDSIIL